MQFLYWGFAIAANAGVSQGAAAWAAADLNIDGWEAVILLTFGD